MMREVTAIIRASKFDDVQEALNAIGVEFFVFYDVKGVTFTKEQKGSYRGASILDASAISRRKIEITVPDVDVDEVVATIKKAAHSGVAGDGKIFVKDVLSHTRISI